jgi:hypothetical protein
MAITRRLAGAAYKERFAWPGPAIVQTSASRL